MIDKLLFDAGLLKIKKTSRWYIYSERDGKDSIALLAYRKQEGNGIEVLIRYQLLPINDENLFPCPITESKIGTYMDLRDLVVEELREEAGILVSKEEIIYLGQYIVGTQTNEIVHCFTCDVSGKPESRPKGDGSSFEKIAYNQWMDLTDLKPWHDDFDLRYSGLIILAGKLRDHLHKIGKHDGRTSLQAFSMDEIKQHVLERLTFLAEHSRNDIVNKFEERMFEESKIHTLESILASDETKKTIEMLFRIEKDGYTYVVKKLIEIFNFMSMIERARDRPETLTDDEKKIYEVE